MPKLQHQQPVPAPAGAAPADAAAPQERVLTFGDVFGRDAGGVIVLLILFGALTLSSDQFLTAENLANLSRQVAIFGIIAVGQLLVILTAGIDLSVGSVLGLTGCVTAELLVHGTGIPVAILGGLAVGLLVGLVNGTLVAYAKLPPFIVTLGMLGIARGVVLVLTDATTVQPLPDSFSNIANGNFLGLPNLLWMFVVVVVVAAFVLRRTVFGRYIYAIGSNPESARLSGVPVTKVLVSVYVIAGLLAAIGGVLFTSRLSAGIPTAGTGYELNAIAACVIGGASLFGAKGGAFGVAAGALIVGVLNNGGNLLAINAFYLQIIIGVLISSPCSSISGRVAGSPVARNDDGLALASSTPRDEDASTAALPGAVAQAHGSSQPRSLAAPHATARRRTHGRGGGPPRAPLRAHGDVIERETPEPRGRRCRHASPSPRHHARDRVGSYRRCGSPPGCQDFTRSAASPSTASSWARSGRPASSAPRIARNTSRRALLVFVQCEHVVRSAIKRLLDGRSTTPAHSSVQARARKLQRYLCGVAPTTSPMKASTSGVAGIDDVAALDQHAARVG